MKASIWIALSDSLFHPPILSYFTPVDAHHQHSPIQPSTESVLILHDFIDPNILPSSLCLESPWWQCCALAVPQSLHLLNMSLPLNMIPYGTKVLNLSASQDKWNWAAIWNGSLWQVCKLCPLGWAVCRVVVWQVCLKILFHCRVWFLCLRKVQ